MNKIIIFRVLSEKCLKSAGNTMFKRRIMYIMYRLSLRKRQGGAFLYNCANIIVISKCYYVFCLVFYFMDVFLIIFFVGDDIYFSFFVMVAHLVILCFGFNNRVWCLVFLESALSHHNFCKNAKNGGFSGFLEVFIG